MKKNDKFAYDVLISRSFFFSWLSTVKENFEKKEMPKREYLLQICYEVSNFVFVFVG